MRPHDVLGVDRDAGVDEVREAYRDKVAETHPRLSDSGDLRHFHRVQRAYERIMEGSASPLGSTSPGDGVDPDRDVMEESLDREWVLMRTPFYEFYLYNREDEPRYLDGEGDRVHDPCVFESSFEARVGYSRFLKHRKIEEYERDNEDLMGRHPVWSGHKIGYKLEIDFDESWMIYYQEKQPLGMDKRWCVYNVDDHVYLDREGEEVEDPFWYDSEDEANEAFESYVDKRKKLTPKNLSEKLPGFLIKVVFTISLLPFKATLLVLDLFLDKRQGGSSLGGLSGRGNKEYLAEAVTVSILFLVMFSVIGGVFAVYIFMHLVTVFIWFLSPYEADRWIYRPRYKRRESDIE